MAAAYNGPLQTASITPAGQGAIAEAYAGTPASPSAPPGPPPPTSTTPPATSSPHTAPPAAILLLLLLLLLLLRPRRPRQRHRSRHPHRVTAAYGYEPYGGHPVATALNGTMPANPWRYSGQYLHSGTGLYKMGARYYDPTLGRFTQKDRLSALADPANGNRYTYTADDPVNFADPSGRNVIGALGGYVAGGIVTVGGCAAFGVGTGGLDAQRLSILGTESAQE